MTAAFGTLFPSRTASAFAQYRLCDNVGFVAFTLFSTEMASRATNSRDAFSEASDLENSTANIEGASDGDASFTLQALVCGLFMLVSLGMSLCCTWPLSRARVLPESSPVESEVR
jgi:hypothetical protein